MSVMDMFRSAVTTVTGGNQQATGAVQPVNDPSAKNPTVPGASSSAGNVDGNAPGAFPKVEADGDKSPLDGYKDFWQAPEGSKGPASLVPSITADPTKLMEAARGVDFTKAISPANLEGIAKGDPKAFLAGINEAAQGAFAQAAGMTSKLLTAALTQQEKTFREEVMPDILRKNNVGNALRADNPLFDNPATAPVLSMIENQMQIKHPGASASDITKLAKEYLGTFATELLAADGKQVTSIPKTEGKVRGATDWEKFFNAPTA